MERGGEGRHVALERGLLRGVSHGPHVRRGAQNRDAEAHARLDVGRAHAARRVGRAGGVDGRVRVGAPRAELDDVRVAGGVHDARGLGGDERRVVQRREEEGLHNLRLDDGRADAHHGLVREDGRALRHGPDVAGEAQGPEVIGERGGHRVGERGDGAEVGDLRVGEAEILEVAEQPPEAHGDQVAPPVREAADEHLAGRRGAKHAAVEVAGGHRELVEVGPEGIHAPRRR